MARHASKHGFTLIELAIVLVIIGLLVGGVLVGRDLIYLAQIRAQVTQIEKYTAGVMAFRLKSACLPGDCAKANSNGIGTAGGYGADGNGNGDINGLTEAGNFWYHLSRS